MKIDRLVQLASISGVAVFIMIMAASASAGTVTYNTNSAGTGFGGSSLTLNNSLGATATFKFIPDADTPVGLASNVNFDPTIFTNAVFLGIVTPN